MSNQHDLYLEQIDDRTVIDDDMEAIIKDLAMTESATGERLTVRQLRAVEVLMTRGSNETIAQVATRAGLSASTMHRYLRVPAFVTEYKARCEADAAGVRHKVIRSLVRGATTPGPNQLGYITLYFKRYGELGADVVFNQTTNTTNVNSFNSALPMDLESIPVDFKREMVSLLERIKEYANSDRKRLAAARNVTPAVALDSLPDGPELEAAGTFQDGEIAPEIEPGDVAAMVPDLMLPPDDGDQLPDDIE